MGWKIGVDGGGTKTECVLIGPAGGVEARHTAPGCNPSGVGTERAAAIASEALACLRSKHPGVPIVATLLCMAGSRGFWKQFGERLQDSGQVTATDDSVPVLELATRGGPGLVVHAGTGSFVAARSEDGHLRYAGGLGWRFGDEGGGYDLGRRAIARALLEFQDWAPLSGLGALVAEQAGGRNASEVAGHFHRDPSAASEIAALAPQVIQLAEAEDPAAAGVVAASVDALLQLAGTVATSLFPKGLPARFRAGSSGPILNHPFVARLAASLAPFPLHPVTEPPIEGVRSLLSKIDR